MRKVGPRLWLWIAVVLFGVVMVMHIGQPNIEEPVQKLRIIDVHEHIQSLGEAPKLLAAMDRVGIEKTLLMGSSWFTITLNHSVGFTRYDENNEGLLRIVQAYPGRFEAWPTVNPIDPRKLEKFKSLIERGATGLKLYSGHGLINSTTGDYMFHPIAIDDPQMFPLYAYCQEHFIPVCIHVNPGPKTPGFADEFVSMLRRFPDLKIDCPHFMLSSIKDSRLREFLDTFPNLYSDVSFGDHFAKAGQTRISKSPKKFRRLFEEYPDRFMFAADLVVTNARFKSEDWIGERLQSYVDMLTKKTYTSPTSPGKKLRGLALPKELADRILYKNYEEFIEKRPRGTTITREIDWSKMGVPKIDRKPGEASLPP
ncbi:MAG TPA: amidohydrolase family protein [Candidatus Hydrogenedentes bacterium]|nr:amidohydrolase family protein [Candidatus Hydrogenedentota bacterium]HIJ74825.1 amidohydrolase family protein [Candidatus Hydrogenedentota bacterium]